MSMRFPQGLYGITPEWDDPDRLADAVVLAARHGMRALQLRRKRDTDAQRLALSQRLLDICRAMGVVFIVNDDWRLAHAIGADGVHVGRDDGGVRAARQALGPSRIVGASCYDRHELALAALADGADYVAFGAVYPSSTKPDAVRADLTLLQRMRAHLDALPAPRPAIVAIGGITPANAEPVVAAGADSIAVISGLFDTPDIADAARMCARLYEPAA